MIQRKWLVFSSCALLGLLFFSVAGVIGFYFTGVYQLCLYCLMGLSVLTVLTGLKLPTLEFLVSCLCMAAFWVSWLIGVGQS